MDLFFKIAKCEWKRIWAISYQVPRNLLMNSRPYKENECSQRASAPTLKNARRHYVQDLTRLQYAFHRRLTQDTGRRMLTNN